MKVRWTANSLRLRITPSELAALVRGEAIEERLRIPGAPAGSGWTVMLLPGNAASELSAEGGLILFDISRTDVARLSEPTAEGIYCNRPEAPDSNNGFSFYVEKDFPCVHPRPSELREAQTETFEAPVGFADRKA